MSAVAVYHDVSARVWALVCAINDAKELESVMTSDVYNWWATHGNDATVIVVDGKQVGKFADVSDLLGCLRDTLRGRDDPRFAAFDKAYRRICTWCDVHDAAESLQGVHLQR